MYSPKVVERTIARVEAAHKLKLERYDLSTVISITDHLASLWDDEEHKIKRKSGRLTSDEASFVRNERLMTSIDFNYWAERYGWFIPDQGGLVRFSPWESQRIILSRISGLEEEMMEAWERGEAVDGILLAIHKARQLGACLIAGTRVLTADLGWVSIENVEVGQQLMSADEYPAGGIGPARKMRLATVLAKCEMFAPTQRVVLADGTNLVGTLHHKFLCKARGATACRWRELQHMQVGDEIRRVVHTWGPPSYEDGWFGGLMDGEGSLRVKTGGAELCVAQVPGYVLGRARCYLEEHGYKYREEIDNRKSGENSKLGNQPVHKLVISRMHDIFRILGQCQPSRFIKREAWWVGKELPNGDTWEKVVAVEPSITQRVFDIQTDTKTYVAEGLVSHNTMLWRLLLLHRTTTGKYQRAITASVDAEDKIQKIYERDERILNNLPWWLKPSIGYDEKRQHIYFDKLDSSILYQEYVQKSGLAQGEQWDVGHLTECASAPYPDTFEHDYFPTIPQSPYALHGMESTAQGRGNWWHSFINDIRKGGTRWRFCFIPYYVEKEKYNRQPPLNWTPSPVSMAHAQKVHESSPEWCGKAIMLSKSKLYWWETTRDDYQRKGQLNIFLTNYCATPEESFQHTTQSAFAPELLDELRTTTRAGVPYEIRTGASVA